MDQVVALGAEALDPARVHRVVIAAENARVAGVVELLPGLVGHVEVSLGNGEPARLAAPIVDDVQAKFAAEVFLDEWRQAPVANGTLHAKFPIKNSTKRDSPTWWASEPGLRPMTNQPQNQRASPNGLAAGGGYSLLPSTQSEWMERPYCRHRAYRRGTALRKFRISGGGR